MIIKSALLATGLMFASTSFAGIFPEVVANLDVPSFLGRWYEVASTHPFFQKDCVCVTADYAPLDDKTLTVVNSCRKVTPDGVLNVVKGTAGTTKNPAKLKVSFGGFNFPFSNYWVIDAAEDYRYAVITTPFRTPVWILSRTPEIAADDLAGIYDRLEGRGFRMKKITPTLQTECSYTAQ